MHTRIFSAFAAASFILLASTAANAIPVNPDGLVSPVPEPATWAMFLAGFGGVGAAIRLARRKVSVSQTA
jgi:hypothetical protein